MSDIRAWPRERLGQVAVVQIQIATAGSSDWNEVRAGKGTGPEVPNFCLGPATSSPGKDI